MRRKLKNLTFDALYSLVVAAPDGTFALKTAADQLSDSDHDALDELVLWYAENPDLLYVVDDPEHRSVLQAVWELVSARLESIAGRAEVSVYGIAEAYENEMQESLALRLQEFPESWLSRLPTLPPASQRSLPGAEAENVYCEAVRCYLLGQDRACAILCGSALEAASLRRCERKNGGVPPVIGRPVSEYLRETLQMELPDEDSKSAWRQAVWLVERLFRAGILDEGLAEKAHRVRKARNDAVHFDRREGKNLGKVPPAADLLRWTQDVLAELG